MYWPGNAAKTEVIGRIVDAVERRGRTVVFDYGCGAGGEWSRVLADMPSIELVAYDPDEDVARQAREKLRATGAEVLTGNALRGLELDADFVVSFSVLEHVYDREAYVRTAKRLLGADGTFYLNYDDGHFRVGLDLERPGRWRVSLRQHSHNVLAPALARIGRVGLYQARVVRADVDALVADVGLSCVEAFYSNCGALKDLYRTVPEQDQEEFCAWWCGVERELNTRFRYTEEAADRGDDTNLWRHLLSRTLVLVHADGRATEL